MPKYLQYILWGSFLLGIMILLGFVESAHVSQKCENVIIQIDQEDGNYFIEEADILKMLPFDVERQDSIAIGSIQASVIEKKLNNHPAIMNAEVYQSLNGNLKIYVNQRRPIARVFNQNNESFYLDENGSLMPLSSKYTARVLIITGNIPDRYADHYHHSMIDVQNDDSMKNSTLLDDLYKLSSFIYENDFWRSQIEHLYVNKDLEVELIPRVGSHTIVFGDIVDIHEKFNKLMLFYKEGLSKTGWNEYSKINLKFDNQVICTKRY